MVLDVALPGEGWGRVLLEAACRYAESSLRANLVWFGVRPDNARAAARYTSAGFTPYDAPAVPPNPSLRSLARSVTGEEHHPCFVHSAFRQASGVASRHRLGCGDALAVDGPMPVDRRPASRDPTHNRAAQS